MRGVERITILLSAICLQTACIVQPAPPDNPVPPGCNTIQDEIEQIAVEVGKDWANGKSAIVCDAIYCLWNQELAESGFPSSPGANYRIHNSKDLDVSIRMNRSGNDSRTVIKAPDKDFLLPSEMDARVSMLSSSEGTATLTSDDETVKLVAEGNDGSVTSFCQTRDGFRLEASLPKAGTLMSISGDDTTVLLIKDNVRVEISGGNLFDVADTYCALREKAQTSDVAADIVDFNTNYHLRVYLRGQLVGDARAEYFCDETGAAVDWVIHYDSETVANSVPYVIFEMIRDFPDFVFPE